MALSNLLTLILPCITFQQGTVLEAPIWMKKYLLYLFLFHLCQTAIADVVLTMGGDVNFNKNRQSVNENGVQYGSSLIPWSSLTQNVQPLINGDLNFANIETVVSSGNDLSDENKKYAFKSHPNAIQNLIDIGFNLFNLANNHTYDYGHAGMTRTAIEMSRLRERNPQILYNGIGFRSDLLEPQVFDLNGIRFAFATVAFGELKFRAKNDVPGILFIRDDSDYQQLIKNFAQTQADFKMLSIHFGTERMVTLDPGQQKRFEYAIIHGKLNLIIGHHPHVIRPIQKIGDSLIFYSLGNYMMVGSADITKSINMNTDWGMFARLYLEKDPATNKVKIDAVDVIPLTNTHFKATPLNGMKAAQRITSLNALSLSQLRQDALLLNLDSLTGTGITCAPIMNSLRAKARCATQITPFQ